MGTKATVVFGMVVSMCLACTLNVWGGWSDVVAVPVGADTYVRGYDDGSYSARNSNMGTQTSFHTYRTSYRTDNRKSYLAFDVDGIRDLKRNRVVDAVLQMRVTNVNPYTGHTTAGASWHGITDNNDWDLSVLSETSITYNNAPKNDLGGSYFVSDGVVELGNLSHTSDHIGEILSYDVTDYVSWALGQNPTFGSDDAYDEDGLISILWANSWPASSYVYWNSKEAVGEDAFAPVLLVTVVPEPAVITLLGACTLLVAVRRPRHC
ncbi:MAG: DNRLRE domain-containing protein [Candidatus Pacebacteria bacterium]|nr:DNRLRE domain-containing protein [Candidatus Paceibacterota bacterium]